MSAPPLPSATSDSVPPPAPVPRSIWLMAAAVLVIVWIGFLAGLTVVTANPPVVNPLQIASSDLVLVGRWKNRTAGQFEVERELKLGQLQGPVVVEDLPVSGPPTNEAWVVPVVKLGKNYAVTHGQFMNAPAQPQANQHPWPVKLPVQCYPATADVLQQIESMLKH